LEHFDVAIVGAGPTGLACGIELQKRGLKPVLFDKGCVVNSIYHYPINLVFFTTPELLEIGDIPMTSLNEKPGRTEALKYYRRVADLYKLNIHQYERVLGFEGADNSFTVRTDIACYGARKIILASGYYDIPNRLNVPGEALEKVIHYYREAHPFYNQDILIVGAKNSAAIAALELYWTGARVTMVIRGSGISHNVKYWIKPNIENRIKNGEIQAYFHSRIKEIRPHDASAPGTAAQLLPGKKTVLQRRHRGAQQQGQSHYEKSLRLSDLPNRRALSVSRARQASRAKTHPQIFLTKLKDNRSGQAGAKRHAALTPM